MTVCLCMIVRDEADWIKPALESARDLGVTSWLIADTGSTDDTPSIVEAHLAGLQGALIHLPWQGHRQTRTELLRRAYSKADWLLMLDADMTITGQLPQGDHDAWRATIHQDAWEYQMLIMFSGSRRWSYEGVVHSYPDIVGEDWTAGDSSLVIQDRRPGGHDPDKFENDAKLLERELESNPLDARSSYYLAQTYDDLGRVNDAIREYGRRALLGGWDEERFVAKYRRAKLLRDRDPQVALTAFLEAWQDRPIRAEPLYQAARLCRQSGWDDLALIFATKAAAIPRPNDRLNIEPAIYQWGVQLELGIAEMRAGNPTTGKRMLIRLRKSGDAPEAIVEWIGEMLGDREAVKA